MDFEEDVKFGKTAITMGFIDEQKLTYCLEQQKTYRQQGQTISLSKLLLHNQFVNISQIAMIQNSIQDTLSLPHKNFVSISRYKILNEIGAGGMGRVYKAHDTQLDRLVALKLLTIGDNEANIQRFIREAKTMANLNHPGIVRVYDIGWEQQNYFYTMDFIQGFSLHDFLSKTPSIRHTVEIMIKIANAIEYAHSQGVIHRDLKPANVMLEDGKEPKVMDFGLAKISNAGQKLTQSGMLMGTLQYMPPEQTEGRTKKIDARSDVYSLGAILYEMLTLRPPFTGLSTPQILEQVLYKKPVAPQRYRKNLPKDLQKICLKALEKTKEHRYQSAAEFTNDLQRFLEKKSIKTNKLSFVPVFTIFLSALSLFFLLKHFFANPPTKSSQKKSSFVKSSQKKSVILAKPKIIIISPKSLETEKFIKVPYTSGTIEIQAQVTNVSRVESILLNKKPIDWNKEQHQFKYKLPLKYKNNSLEILVLDQKGSWILRRWEIFRHKPPGAQKDMFRGNPSHTGIYKTKGVRKLKGCKWVFKTGKRVWSSPVTVDGIIYFGSDDHHLYAVEAENGRLEWKFKAGNVVATTPVVTSGKVYFGSHDHNFYAVNAYNGQELWRYNSKNWIESSPVMAMGTIFFGNKNGYIYALDSTTGKLKWKFKTTLQTLPVVSTPAIANNLLFVGSWHTFCYGIDLKTGKAVKGLRTSEISSIYNSPAIANGMVYFGDLKGYFYAYDIATGAPRWKYKTKDRIISSAAVDQNTVYFGSWDTYFYALDNQTGEKKWHFKTGYPIESSPAIAEGAVYFGSWDTYFYALDKTNGKLLWKFKTPHRMTSSPRVADGVIYFGCYDGNLYALW